MDTLTFAFDIGTGSIGEAVRLGREIVAVESLLVPDTFPSAVEERSRRRQYRTRLAHKAREAWLRKVAAEAGLEVLHGRNPGNRHKGIPATPGDPRLEREFPARGDNTCYASALLRVKLLRGEPLASWQVYKALHSAIQRRGYDANVPWKHGDARSKASPGEVGDEEDRETSKAVEAYVREVADVVGSKAEWQYPCYLDAALVGLWSPKDDRMRLRIDHKAKRARGANLSPRVPPREWVEREIRHLVEAASLQYPGLKGKADYLLYGPAGVAYASHDAELRRLNGLKEGAETDWQGVLGQKIPRFDNRVVAPCRLIPRYHVCRADDGLCIETTFLLKLMNLRVQAEGQERGLNIEEVRELHQRCKDNASREVGKIRGEWLSEEFGPPKKVRRQKERSAAIRQWKLTRSALTKWLAARDLEPVAGHELVEEPSGGGRSAFSRPALGLLRDLILSGRSPHAFHLELEGALGFDSSKGLVPADVSFLLAMPKEWQGIHIPRQSLVERYAATDPNAGIRAMLAEVRNPIVEHRLRLLNDRLDLLVARFGRSPDHVVLEFIREEFMGAEALKRYNAQIRENRIRRQRLFAKVDQEGLAGRGSLLKLQLHESQGGCCLYTGQPIGMADLDDCEIDHIVPREAGGSDAAHNKILTRRTPNHEKGKRTPYEWLYGTPGWKAYYERVTARRSQLGPRRTALLTTADAHSLDEKYTSLAETAWIARLSRDLIALKFGWDPGAKGEAKRISIISGGLTAKVRRDNRLDGILAPDEHDPDAIMKKNRADKRHHALDAMVLAYIPEWARDKSRREDFKLPNGIHKEYFRAKLDDVVPRHLITEPAALEQTIYARRQLPQGETAVKRVELRPMPYDGQGKIFKASRGAKQAASIVDPVIREDIQSFFEAEPPPTSHDWESFLDTYRVNGGARVVRVAVTIGSPGKLDEYADLSRDGDERVCHLRKGAKHEGYFVHYDMGGKPVVRPVYVHESRRKIERQLRAKRLQIVGYFWANCRVRIDREVLVGTRVIPAGDYLCQSIWQSGQVVLDLRSEVRNNPINISHLLKAGFCRI